ncbi:NAD(P)H-hydrate dehydratase [Virgibacillus sp. 179-BFC.A HS]|uniref:Bifunctional NAD(P)H-hydrate repair enzyme n=1 Tax=Tigheibacillus jepli TaxID=3035914 RepID=A0ABU5CM59_9BACI|nr:NAD(P)H-hydrate dehydratase [Virgibacillus sp. 179-BFC.A HS]MDY0406902.1 NAD(P)H-hydrate dehydratase [Virgibacillus sp. 179-BFC.A HS]
MFIVTAKEMYDIDHCTMQKIGFGKLLMENAGREVARKISQRARVTDKLLVVVGPGNNGGDGFVVARTLLNEQFDVKVLQAVPDEKLSEQVQFYKNLYHACGGEYVAFDGDGAWKKAIAEADIVVDALLGIGIKGAVRKGLDAVVTCINERAKKVLAVDIPSGLPADEGLTDFTAVKADETIIIAAPKISTFLPHTAGYYGKWEVVSIGHPAKLFAKSATRFIADSNYFQRTMPKRNLDAHKGSHGKGLVIGGSDHMPGSFAMTLRAALRAGAGLITAASTEKVIDGIANLTPEAMYQTIASNDGWLTTGDLPLDGKDAVAIGIGMGRHADTAKLLQKAVNASACPLIIDGDGLYHLQNNLHLLKQRKHPTILTPHMGEMARLLQVDISELAIKPFHYAKVFAEKYNVYIVLKGRFTIITAPDGRQAVNTTGNQGLAKGGSGDVLTGIVLSMVMQPQSIFQALCNACFVHGMSADLQIASGHTYYDLLATDVIEGIAGVYRHFLDPKNS